MTSPSTVASVKESVKESLLGTEEPEQFSAQTRAAFAKYARKDESGELFMGEDEFVNAVAPEEQDYVCHTMLASFVFVFVFSTTKDPAVANILLLYSIKSSANST